MALDPRIALGFDNSQIYNPVQAQAAQQGLQLRNIAIQQGQNDVANLPLKNAALQNEIQNIPLHNQALDQSVQRGALELNLSRIAAVYPTFAGVNSQEGLNTALNHAQSMGMDVSSIPKTYEPDSYGQWLGGAKQAVLAAIPPDKQFDMLMKTHDSDRADRLANNTIQHNANQDKAAAYRATGGGSFVDPTTGDIVQGSNSQNFGFPVQQLPPVVQHARVTEDSKQRTSDRTNIAIGKNVNDILDELEPNLDKFDTGGMIPSVRATVARGLGTDSGDAAANIEKGTQALATELGKFQTTPGARGSVLGLQTILNSKPGVQYPNQTNKNIVASIRSKVNDTTNQATLAEAYREANPLNITDNNTYKLDEALRTLYPSQTVDPKTGKVTYNADNVQAYKDNIEDAIRNPQKFFQMAEHVKSGKVQPGAGSADLPQGVTAEEWAHMSPEDRKLFQ